MSKPMITCALAVITLLIGCQGAAPRMEGSAMEIQILGFADCPNTPAFRERVEDAARQVGGFRVIYIDQESLPADDLRRGYATPTALINGEDLFRMPRPETPSMGCRMYPGGLPSTQEIAAQLRDSEPG